MRSYYNEPGYFAVYYVSKNIVTTLGSKDEGYNTQFKKSVILKNALP
jgi:hypothetical protein